MFEAVHGSAPDIAGKGIANPSGLLNGAILMLHHIGQSDVAVKIENALMKTIEDGVHTADIAAKGTNSVGTSAFADAVIANLGQQPKVLPLAAIGEKKMIMPKYENTTKSVRTKRLAGVDVFLDWAGKDVQALSAKVEASSAGALKLVNITTRGTQVYPRADTKRVVTDHWRCRFEGKLGSVQNADIRAVLSKLEEQGLDWIKTESLYYFDEEKCYSA